MKELTLTLLLTVQAVVSGFCLSSPSALRHPLARQTRRSNSASDFLSGLFKDPKKVSAERLAKAETLKRTLLQVTTGTSNGIKASEGVRGEVAKIVKDLEALNDIKTISSSPVMNGNWKLLYTTNDGSSAGRLGPFIGRVDQLIDVSGSKYINYVRLGGVVRGALSATWDNLSPKLWRVKFIDLEISVFGIPVTKKPLNAQGTWRMTYLDEDIRVLYAQGGKNTLSENIYILGKDKLSFSP